MTTTSILNSLIPISQFNKGQASRIFDRLQTEDQLIVLKNNTPEAVILSPKEYERLTEMEEDNFLLAEAYERLQGNDGQTGIPMDAVMNRLGITDEELNTAGDVVVE